MAFLAFLAVALFFLLTEHTAHVLGALPYLLLVADGTSNRPGTNAHGSST
jgi:hypothetical protein